MFNFPWVIDINGANEKWDMLDFKVGRPIRGLAFVPIWILEAFLFRTTHPKGRICILEHLKFFSAKQTTFWLLISKLISFR